MSKAKDGARNTGPSFLPERTVSDVDFSRISAEAADCAAVWPAQTAGRLPLHDKRAQQHQDGNGQNTQKRIRQGGGGGRFTIAAVHFGKIERA